MRARSWLSLVAILLTSIPTLDAADDGAEIYLDPAEAGHDYEVQGEYVGTAKIGKTEAPWGAQIIALGDHKFDLVLFQGGLPGAGWFRGADQKKASGSSDGTTATFEGEGWTAVSDTRSLKVVAGDAVLGELKKTARASRTLGATPPKGATVLFDGSSAEKFKNGEIVMGDLLLANCETVDKFGDHRLHIEFRTPFKPTGRGQGRGNSGVYIQNRYECQVLDSFGLEGKDNECGGIYSISQPLVNACLPPLTWQTYDIDFTAARWEGDKKVENARVTIRHNGIVIHNNLELPHNTPGKNKEAAGPDGFYLQGHGNPVVYRNIWVQPKTEETEEGGFVSLFDGKTLENWDGNPKFWSVKDGTISGQTTAENPTKGNTFIVWRGGEFGEFELKLQYKIIGGNSGIQYRSFEVPDQQWLIGGYQGDFEAGKTYSGILYGERFRGILANRGLTTEIGSNHKPRVLGHVGESSEIQKRILDEDWNDYHITARDFHFIHRINGTITSECYDEDSEQRRSDGLLALQLHAGPPMLVQFRNIRIRQLGEAETAAASVDATPKEQVAVAAKEDTTKVVLIAGKKSHGYGSHEHRAGCMLLADALNNSGLGIEAVVISEGWPEDDSILNSADAIVIYADGGGRHPALPHLKRLDELMEKGVGLSLIHYGVEIPKGDGGDAFVRWTGGYFETDWSVNPHWTADYARMPNHPVTRGVKPFVINDEWYYHMRFREQMRGVTPILTAVPPESTLSRPDGAHSGNPHVRAKKGQPQHMAWASERSDGGRGFGFTGGHYHWNWGHNDFRKLVLNAIVWTAGLDVPSAGVPNEPVTARELEANQDYEPSKKHNTARIQKMIDEWNSAS